MNTEEKTATTKPRPKKITFNKSMLSFKEQTDWPWKALFRTLRKFQSLIKIEWGMIDG